MTRKKALLVVTLVSALVLAIYHRNLTPSAPQLSTSSTREGQPIPYSHVTVQAEKSPSVPPSSLAIFSSNVTAMPTPVAVMTTASWAGGISPELNRMLNGSEHPDAEILAAAKFNGTNSGWHADDRILNEGRYRVLFTKSKTDLAAALLLEMDLAYSDPDSHSNFVARKLLFKMDGKNVQTFDFSSWSSPFVSNEIFGASLHLPFDEFWKKIFPGMSCVEILVAETGWSIPENLKNTTSFSGRVFCRQSLENATSLGWMTFCQGERC